MPHGLHLLHRVHKGLLRKGHGSSGDPTTGSPAGLAWTGAAFLPVTLKCFPGFESKTHKFLIISNQSYVTQYGESRRITWYRSEEGWAVETRSMLLCVA